MPGHGPVGTKDDVRVVRDILSFFIEIGTRGYAEGVSQVPEDCVRNQQGDSTV